jgi:hypothetical protein
MNVTYADGFFIRGRPANNTFLLFAELVSVTRDDDEWDVRHTLMPAISMRMSFRDNPDLLERFSAWKKRNEARK